MTPEGELEKWVGIKQEAINEAEAALRKARFAEQVIDRLLIEADVVVVPHLYIV